MPSLPCERANSYDEFKARISSGFWNDYIVHTDTHTHKLSQVNTHLADAAEWNFLLLLCKSICSRCGYFQKPAIIFWAYFSFYLFGLPDIRKYSELDHSADTAVSNYSLYKSKHFFVFAERRRYFWELSDKTWIVARILFVCNMHKSNAQCTVAKTHLSIIKYTPENLIWF